MKSTKKSLLASVLLGCVLVLVATTAFSAEWKVPAQWKFLRFAGGSAAGSWTPTSAKISELINKQIPGVNASSTLGGSYSNCTKVDEGKMQIAFTQADVLAKELAGDTAIQAADTLLLTVPNQLGVEYNTHAIESILRYVAPELGWR